MTLEKTRQRTLQELEDAQLDSERVFIDFLIFIRKIGKRFSFKF